MKKVNIFILAILFMSAIGYSQNADPGININMMPASLSLFTNGILEVKACNNGATPIVSNSLRIVVSVGTNAEIIGIQAGSDPRYTIQSLTSGVNNTIIMTNSGGTIGFLDCPIVNLIVKGKVVMAAQTITGTIGYITGGNPLLGGGQNASQGNLNSGNDNSTSSLTVTAFLPVVLESFGASLINCKTELNWKTSAEDNLRNYELEMSLDGINFESIAKVDPKGKHGNGSSYNFSYDSKNGTIYYRLKSVDNNGSYSYSNVVNVKKDCGKRSVSVYPNPVSEVLSVEIKNSTDEDQGIGVLYNISGAEVGRYVLNNTNTYLKVSNFTAGVYYLKVSSQELNETFKVMIEK